jgi:hypothetical protein
MATYEIYAFCPYCCDVHRTSRRVELDQIFECRSIAEAFGRDRLPARLAFAMWVGFRCPKTNRSYVPRDRSEILLLWAGGGR